jgi:hypothetical protein
LSALLEIKHASPSITSVGIPWIESGKWISPSGNIPFSLQ